MIDVDQIKWLKDKLQSWPGEMALTSEDIADLIALLDQARPDPPAVSQRQLLHDAITAGFGGQPAPLTEGDNPTMARIPPEPARPRPWDPLLSLPADEERREMVDFLHSICLSHRDLLHVAAFTSNEQREEARKELADWENKILALLLAPSTPVRVGREWVEETAATLVCVTWTSINSQNKWLTDRLREKGVLVEDRK